MRGILLVLCGGVMVGACSDDDRPPSLSLTPVSTTSTSLPAASSTDLATTVPSTSLSSSTSATPSYLSVISPVDEAVRSRMTASWRVGCPVPLEELRHLQLGYWGYDGLAHVGELIAHHDVADSLARIFGVLWEARFPIERMELVDRYDADDNRSMAANNTSAFNCREIDGEPGRWSNHAYGLAIDINPLVNPLVRGTQVDPIEGERFADRTLAETGMIHEGDVVVQAFLAEGWTWGGAWSSSKDYQHFDAPGV